MKPEVQQVRTNKRREGIGRWSAASTARLGDERARKSGGKMTAESRSRQMQAAAAHPVSELMDCPPQAGSLLSASAQAIAFEAGQVIFRQASPCIGLYLVVQGQLQRRTERHDTRITLGISRPGDLVELAAALAEGDHTYSLVAQSSGSLLMLPIQALQEAFESHPPLRMKLLEELAREVSRAYHTCSLAYRGRSRRSALDPPSFSALL